MQHKATMITPHTAEGKYYQKKKKEDDGEGKEEREEKNKCWQGNGEI